MSYGTTNRIDERGLLDLQGLISRQGVVVIQTQVDVHELLNRGAVDKNGDNYVKHPVRYSMDDAIIRIDPMDLVFTVDNSQKPSTFGGFANTAVPVLSCLNGIYAMNDDDDDDNARDGDNKLSDSAVLQKLSEKIRFVGIALTAANPNPQDSRTTLTQVTTLTQGTVTLINTGGLDIRCGDTLMWDIPTKEDHKGVVQRFGHSDRKMALKLVPRRNTQQNIHKALKDVMNGKKNAGGDNPKAVDKFAKRMRDFLKKFDEKRGTDDFDEIIKDMSYEGEFSKLLVGFMAIEDDLRRRTVGKALSFSKPGHPVDVFICPT